MNGILNIYKEAGFTSHDVVAKLRGILHTRKIGHTGTLDPMAEGVLPVCIGNATGLCDMVAEDKKEYETILLLGVTTDTQDVTGTILSERECAVSETALRDIINGFIGPYEQIPPMYSAKKIGGRKLYELAREGKEIERKPSHVILYGIEILDIDFPRVKMRVVCSKGTYIRTLCHDIGLKAGCGGTMEFLLRTRVGSFYLQDSLKLSDIEKEVCALTNKMESDNEKKSSITAIPKSLMSVETYFSECPAVHTKKSADKWLYNGNILNKQDTIQMPENHSQKAEQEIQKDKYDISFKPIDGIGHLNFVRMYDECGVFYGIYEYDRSENSYKPRKMFIPESGM